MSAVEALIVLDRLEGMGNARNVKVDLMKEHQNNVVLRDIFTYTYDWLTTYGIVAQKPKYDDYVIYNGEENWERLTSLLNRLSSREITGNDAREEWDNFLSRCGDSEKKWYTRILNRDLRIGVGAKLVKKVWPNALSPFGCQLAETYEKSDGIKQFPVWVEPKIDGMRVILVRKGATALCYSRSGKELPTLQFLADRAAESTDEDFVLDGEVFLRDWNTTVSLAKTYLSKMSKEKKELLPHLGFYVFDYLPIKEFESGESKTPLRERREQLARFMHKLDSVQFCALEYAVVHTEEEIEPLYESLLTEGYEGGMIKDPDGGYKHGRSKRWLKIKAEEDIDAYVIDVLPGTGRNESRMGAMEIQLEDGSTARIGTGYTDEQRESLWRRRSEIIGKVAEFRVQKDASHVASARFPRFLGIRDDK